MHRLLLGLLLFPASSFAFLFGCLLGGCNPCCGGGGVAYQRPAYYAPSYAPSYAYSNAYPVAPPPSYVAPPHVYIPPQPSYVIPQQQPLPPPPPSYPSPPSTGYVPVRVYPVRPAYVLPEKSYPSPPPVVPQPPIPLYPQPPQPTEVPVIAPPLETRYYEIPSSPPPPPSPIYVSSTEASITTEKYMEVEGEITETTPIPTFAPQPVEEVTEAVTVPSNQVVPATEAMEEEIVYEDEEEGEGTANVKEDKEEEQKGVEYVVEGGIGDQDGYGRRKKLFQKLHFNR